MKEFPKIFNLFVIIRIFDNVVRSKREILKSSKQFFKIEGFRFLFFTFLSFSRCNVLNDLVKLFIELLNHVFIHLVVYIF